MAANLRSPLSIFVLQALQEALLDLAYSPRYGKSASPSWDMLSSQIVSFFFPSFFFKISVELSKIQVMTAHQTNLGISLWRLKMTISWSTKVDLQRSLPERSSLLQCLFRLWYCFSRWRNNRGGKNREEENGGKFKLSTSENQHAERRTAAAKKLYDKSACYGVVTDHNVSIIYFKRTCSVFSYFYKFMISDAFCVITSFAVNVICKVS